MAIVNGAGGAHYTGVATCASVWACAVCSAKVRTGRAAEVEAVVAAHLARGGTASFVTLTTPHDLGDNLPGLWDAVAAAWRKVISGRRWTGLAAGVGAVICGKYRIGLIRSLEVTYGRNGWHPHLHVLVLTGPGVDVGEVGRYIGRRWAAAVDQLCGRQVDPWVGVVASPVTAAGDAARYIVKEQDGRKIGAEMARHDLKVGRRAGRTPFQLLESADGDGDAADLARWRHYERASKGRQAITFSRGLRKEYCVAEVTDEELAAAEDPGELVLVFSEQEWRLARRSAHGMIALLEAAERKGAQGVLDTLDALAVWLAGQPPGT